MWTIPQFPFFLLLIKKDSYTGKYGYWQYGEYNTFQEAAKACVAYVKKQISNRKKIDSFTKQTTPLFEIDNWVGNNGNGIYIRNQEWKKYIWLEAGYNPHSSISKGPAIRFPIETPKEVLRNHATKIEARHTARFHKVADAIAEGTIFS